MQLSSSIDKATKRIPAGTEGRDLTFQSAASCHLSEKMEN